MNRPQPASVSLDNAGSLASLLDYHQSSKHYLHGYAAGPETLDWDDQPDPFRQFSESFYIDLPLPDTDHLPVNRQHLFYTAAATQLLTLGSLALFLRFSAGLSAWKTFGTDRWSLRTVPSSGNLHPGELYLLLPSTGFCKAGLYHYDVFHHRLTLRALLPEHAQGAVYLIQTSVLQREAWKYGVRGLRYCWLDAGHQRAQCQAVAGLLGWQIDDVAISRTALAQLCGLNRLEYQGVELEYAEWICQLHFHYSESASDKHLQQLMQSDNILWSGQPNRLAPEPLQTWEQPFTIAGQVDTTPTAAWRFPRQGRLSDSFVGADDDPWKLILRRRSGQAYNAESRYPRERFEQMIAALQPGGSRLLPEQPRIHLLCFVHAVDGLEPGIYLLPRSAAGAQLFADQLQRWQPWEEIELAGSECVWRMKIANTRKAVGQLCCHQAIAAASSFTLIFLAEFEQPMNASQGAIYPQLYEEAGMLGQQIYLHSTAQGYSGTGIGCFFDDAIHELIGLDNQSLQAVYGFAVGDPVRDQRITQLSGYYHLRERFV